VSHPQTAPAALAGPSPLGLVEVRVLGCLMEKQRTTPDAYPLSLNALRLACNQATNRDPVVEYGDDQVRESLHRLERRGLVRLASGRGSRAAKYRHLLAEALPMSSAEQAVMTVLMLRGTQTPGELKQRTERMHAFAGLEAVNDTLGRLIERGLVARLPRRPGQKEERYAQLLEGDETGEAPSRSSTHADGGGRQADPEGEAPPTMARAAGRLDADGSLQALHERVARLEREVAELRARLGSGAPA
jgi:uncharacterized protein YceH (UPF0502 family)